MDETDNTAEPGRSRSNAARHSALMRRASMLAERGLYDEAIINIKKAMALRPRDARCSLQLAHVLRAQHQMGAALEAMKRAIELDPMNSLAHEQLLRILLEMGRYDEAITTSYGLLARSPKNLFARDILGLAYLQQGMLDKALKVTEELIRIDPTDAAHYFKRGVLLQQKGEIGQAMAAFLQAHEMDPEGEMADDSREAIAALDSYQLRQVLTVAIEDTVFRTKLALDPESALFERGFRLSPSGVAALRQIDLNDLSNEPQSRYYH